jgi:hypothetical protein
MVLVARVGGLHSDLSYMTPVRNYAGLLAAPFEEFVDHGLVGLLAAACETAKASEETRVDADGGREIPRLRLPAAGRLGMTGVGAIWGGRRGGRV